MTAIFDLRQADSPLLVSMPHSGLQLPDTLKQRLTAEGLALVDTDWHIPQLYDFLDDMGVSIIKANYSRYVVDLNRPPGGDALYPGQRETEVCSISTFMDQPLYHSGQEPTQEEVAERVTAYWNPYHERIESELKRIKERFGYALLWDAHSIQSLLPRFFAGRLPNLNLGTVEGRSCDNRLSDDLFKILAESRYKAIQNGRFKGGFITRHYGDPINNVHAVQMEISQISYMSEFPEFEYDENRANELRIVLRSLLETMLSFNHDNA